MKNAEKRQSDRNEDTYQRGQPKKNRDTEINQRRYRLNY